eukprot:scaffold2858_cov659-Pavlova_lutheri.AAC.170
MPPFSGSPMPPLRHPSSSTCDRPSPLPGTIDGKTGEHRGSAQRICPPSWPGPRPIGLVKSG